MPRYNVVTDDDDSVHEAAIYFPPHHFGEADDGAPGLPDESYYPAIRHVLSEDYSDLTDDEIDNLMDHVLARMAPDEAEGFWDVVGSVGKQLAGAAGTILPAVAPMVGTAIGGPVGGMIGGMVGQMAGQALGGGKAQAPAAAPPPMAAAAPARAPAMPPPRAVSPAPTTQPTAPAAGSPLPPGASSAVAQLLSLIQNPTFLSSLLGQTLGQAGESTVPVGTQGKLVPFGEWMNALSVLAHEAAAEADDWPSDQGTAEYLLDAEGYFRVDPADPEQRAPCLLHELREAYLAEASGDDDEEVDELTEWFVDAGLVEARHRPRRRHRRPTIPRPHTRRWPRMDRRRDRYARPRW